MRVRVFVTLKKTILDPQGKAIQQALQSLGYTQVKDARLGKYIELELAPEPPEAARRRVSEMCERLLANTVIEEYRFDIDSQEESGR